VEREFIDHIGQPRSLIGIRHIHSKNPIVYWVFTNIYLLSIRSFKQSQVGSSHGKLFTEVVVYPHTQHGFLLKGECRIILKRHVDRSALSKIRRVYHTESAQGIINLVVLSFDKLSTAGGDPHRTFRDKGAQ